jgi:tetratricopeptide (TPR) repeat protein
VLFRFLLFLVAGFCSSGVSVAAGEQHRFEGQGNAFSISGRVYASNGAPLASVRIRIDSLMRGAVAITYTGVSGSFSFGNLPAGSYVLVIEAPGYRPVRRPIEVGDLPAVGLEIRLMPEARGAEPYAIRPVSVRQLLIPDKARKEYRKGRKAQARGKTDEAIRHLEKAIEIHPDYAESFMQLGKIFADRSDFARALEAAKRAVVIDDRNADGYNCLGYVYMKKKEYPKARKAFEKAIELLEPNWYAHLELGRLLLREKEVAEARPHLARAHELHPTLANVHLLLYNDLVLLGRKQEALAEIDEFLTLFPKDPRIPKIRQVREALAKSLGVRKH